LLAMHLYRGIDATIAGLQVRATPPRFVTLSWPQCAGLLIVDASVRPSRASALRAGLSRRIDQRQRDWVPGGSGATSLNVEATMGVLGPKILACSQAALALALLAWIGMPAPAAAQGTVRSVHNDWQVRCDTPPGAQSEQCALIQSVTAEDRAN